MKLFSKIFLTATLLASFAVHASLDSVERAADYSALVSDLTIDKVEVQEVELDEFDKAAITLNDIDTTLGQVISVTDKFITLGSKVWKIIVANKPSLTTKFASPISILPKNVKDEDSFGMMAGWSEPIIKKYVINLKNFYGMTVVSFSYAILMQAGGTDESGKGKYITGLTVIPSGIYVGWGWTFNASSELINVANKGTIQNPIASANIAIDYSATTVLNELKSRLVFHVDANGKVVPLN